MTAMGVSTDWFTRRRYIGYLLVVCGLGGFVAGALLGDEHTLLALAVLGVTALLAALPRVVSDRRLFDERDCRIDDRAARYTMYVVMVLGLGGLIGPIVLEQLGVREVTGGGLLIGLVMMGLVYLYVGISLVLRYRA